MNIFLAICLGVVVLTLLTYLAFLISQARTLDRQINKIMDDFWRDTYRCPPPK